jgi:hypothetical protein
MPTISEQEISGWAHCEDALCAGNHQTKVQVIATTTEHTGADREAGQDTSWGTRSGALARLVENSWTEFRFASEADRACPVCGRDRICSDQKRPVYEARSGHSQKGLLWIRQFGSVQAGEAYERAEIATKAAEAKEAELAAKRRLEAAEAQLQEVAEPPAAADEAVKGAGVAENGNGHEGDPRTTAILQAYVDAGESSVKAAELLAETEHAVSDRTVRTLVGKHPELLAELKGAA